MAAAEHREHDVGSADAVPAECTRVWLWLGLKGCATKRKNTTTVLHPVKEGELLSEDTA